MLQVNSHRVPWHTQGTVYSGMDMLKHLTCVAGAMPFGLPKEPKATVGIAYWAGATSRPLVFRTRCDVHAQQKFFLLSEGWLHPAYLSNVTVAELPGMIPLAGDHTAPFCDRSFFIGDSCILHVLDTE